MVKDFGSGEYITSWEFTTNTDVPTVATRGIIADPVNPFTGKEITDDENTHDQYALSSGE